ncbi:MAG: hypothetical protein K0S65_4473 [Labilithrix sp.]|nr:hypothetical protein [Labilithrix sp.]
MLNCGPMLNCEECATQPATVEEALRWRAYLIAVVEDDGDEEVAEVAVYCPECADREFGDRRRLNQRPGAGSNPRN